MTGQLARAQGLGQPRQRGGIEMASSDLPARSKQKRKSKYKSKILKGTRARTERTVQRAIRVEAVDLVPPPADGSVADGPWVAVSATEVDPPDEGEPLPWGWLTTARPADGEAPAVFAATVGEGYRQRGSSRLGFGR